MAVGERVGRLSERPIWEKVVDRAYRLRVSLPRGKSLPVNVWQRRHQGIVVLLWLHVGGLTVFGLTVGVAPLHLFAEMGILALLTFAASNGSFSPRIRACLATTALMASSALFTHLSGGYIEVHFHFFIMLGVIGLYQDWLPFGLSLTWVLLHHGVVGAIDPGSVFNHPDALLHPWKWAGIHALFVAGASVVNVIAWKLNEERAMRDSLTGLASAALLADHTEHALARKERSGKLVSVLFIDLDGFKAINDRYGHGVGDQLLMQVGQKLSSCLRAGDACGRIGGDEFGVLLEDHENEMTAVLVAERILASLREPMSLHGREMKIDASIGIANAGEGELAEDLLRNADAAMYVAKKAGRGRVQVYEPSLHQTVLERLDLVAELKHAIDFSEFELHYQPIVSLDGGHIGGVEALIRWRHPARGLLGPFTFIPVAEESGVIIEIGRWVLAESCAQLRRWLDQAGDIPLSLSVNISARQLQEKCLVEDVTRALQNSQIEPERLVLEITESVFMEDVDTVLERVQQLKALGVRLALDDFGTGYSSLGYLNRFPIDIIKIDKTFVDQISGAVEDVALIKAIIQLSKSFGLSTVAEGIEEAGQAERLATLGCLLGQGFLWSRPVPPGEISDVLGRQLTAPVRESA